VKKKSDESADEVDAIIFRVAETLRVCGILLQPYMPAKASELLDMLGVDGSKRAFEHTKFGCDDSYGQSQVDLKKGQDGVLFPPLLADA
jgi:methionyl-tRNA synthetase